MKITKEMTAEMRAGALDAMESKMIPGSSTELLINPLVLLALLDERKALRAALGDLVEWVEGMPDEALRAAEIRSTLALGDDEE